MKIINICIILILVYISIILSIWHYHWNMINSKEYKQTLETIYIQKQALTNATDYIYNNDSVAFIEYQYYYNKLNNE